MDKRMKRRKIIRKIRSIPARIIGSVICSIFFAVIGIIYGLCFLWISEDEPSKQSDDTQENHAG